MPAASSSHAATAPDVCRHCGDPCEHGSLSTPDGPFCCRGCEAVFTLLRTSGMDAFYTCATAAGTSQKHAEHLDAERFAVLDDPLVSGRLMTFEDEHAARAVIPVPTIHCASCVWLLEQLWRFDRGVTRSEVDLLRRTVRVEFRRRDTSLRRIAERLATLGYEPAVSPEDAGPSAPSSRRRLHLQIGLAGFAFGNIMLFSIPRYVNGGPLDGGFQHLFDTLNLILSVPVLLYSASDYFRTAWQALRARSMALEVPVALGLAVLFLRSLFDITVGHTEGFFDSFAGLTFFLLIGRLFQQKVFDRIAFDRTFRSFLPLSVRVERSGGIALVPLDAVQTGDCIEIRRHEIVPADARLLSDDAMVDYAFITGEQTPVQAVRGDIVRAGGRAAGGTMRLHVVRDVSHSHLASLWNNPIFAKPKSRWLATVAARFGAWFTVGAVGLAAAGAIAWWPDVGASASVATAVLIIACPCALTLAAPITLGTAMGLLGTRGLYLKHPAVAFDMSRIDLVIFDKTGTLTAGGRSIVETGEMSGDAWALVRALASHSTHPASRAIASSAVGASIREQPPVGGLVEVAGEGISGWVRGVRVAIGTAAFAARHGAPIQNASADRTYVVAGGEHAWVRLSSAARRGVEEGACTLARTREAWLLSGDHDGERPRWARLFGDRLRFRQTPHDKLAFVTESRASGRHVLMIGDGLNDSGALAAADVGITVSDDTACIVPACDAVIAGNRLADLPAFLGYAARARAVVRLCFIVSVVYNVIGLALALQGSLTPLSTAILMPVSSLTIVALSSGAMRWSARRMLPS